MATPQFRPTRTYPHRSCRWTHNLTPVIGLIVVTEILQTGIAMIVVMAASIVLASTGYAALRRKKYTEIMREEAANAVEDASPHAPRVDIHQGWLRTAVTMDAVIIAQSLVVAYILGGQAGQNLPAPVSIGDALAIGAGVLGAIGIVWLHSKAHRCAATPATDAFTGAPSPAVDQ